MTSLHPDEMSGHVERCAALLGGSDVELLLVDIDQRNLRQLHGALTATYDVVATGPTPGTAYRLETTVRHELGERRGVRSWIPLMDSAERLGVLGVTVPGDEDPELWTAFASIIGEALVSKTAYGDNITRTRRPGGVTLAAEMRWALLPPLTFRSPYVEISGVLEPAYDIAGDTFDYAVNGDVLSFAILDAMGHGLEASQIANLAISEYRRGRRADLGLGDLLRGIDGIVAAEFGDSRFVTGQLAQLDLGSGRLTLVNAGHPPPILLRQGRDAGDVPCRPSPPMGLGLIHTEEAQVDLAEGDAVLLYSDGVTEARPTGGEQFGRERLADLAAAALGRDERPAEVLRQVVQAASEHTDGPMADDATAVIVRRGRPLRR